MLLLANSPQAQQQGSHVPGNQHCSAVDPASGHGRPSPPASCLERHRGPQGTVGGSSRGRRSTSTLLREARGRAESGPLQIHRGRDTAAGCIPPPLSLARVQLPLCAACCNSWVRAVVLTWMGSAQSTHRLDPADGPNPATRMGAAGPCLAAWREVGPKPTLQGKGT